MTTAQSKSETRQRERASFGAKRSEEGTPSGGFQSEAEAKSGSASAPHLENCTGETKHPAEASSAEGNERDRKETEGTERDRKRGMRKRTQKEPSRHEKSLRSGAVAELARSSEKERRVDARALIAEEGRDKLRKAMGSCK